MDDTTFQFIVPKLPRFIAKQRFIYRITTMGTIQCWYVTQLPPFISVLRINKRNTEGIVHFKYLPSKV